MTHLRQDEADENGQNAALNANKFNRYNGAQPECIGYIVKYTQMQTFTFQSITLISFAHSIVSMGP